MKTYIDLIRHGEAMKEVAPGIEIQATYWPLTPKGIEQALALRARYTKSGEFEKISLVLHSDAPRALCTAAIVAAGISVRFSEVKALWPKREDPNHGEKVWAAFDKYHCDLVRYLEDAKAYRALLFWGTAGAYSLRGEIGTRLSCPKKQDDIVLVAGHAVLLNFLAFQLGHNDKELLKIPLGEAERIRLVFENGSYTGFTR